MTVDHDSPASSAATHLHAPATAADGDLPADADGDARQNRRTVLCGLAVTALASGALVACSTGDSSGSSAPSTAPGTALAKVSDIPVGGGHLVQLPNGDSLLLLRPTADVVHAVVPICPHAGAPLPEPQNGQIVCPLHGSVFDANTGALKQGPASRGLSQVPVSVRGDQVVTA